MSGWTKRMRGTEARGRLLPVRHDAIEIARERWADSRDALDLAEAVRLTAGDIVRHGDALLDHPADPQIRAAARADARKIIGLCDHLERLSR